MPKNNLKNLLVVTLGILTFIGFFWHVFLFRSDIFKKFDSNYWTNKYNRSQWVVSFSKNPIGDDGLYIYAGYRYMMGDDPSLLNAELPPFGKYLVGLFEISTGFVGIFSVFFSFLFLVLLFFVNKKIFQSSLISMASLAIFSIEPLFYSQIRAPFLDTAYASFLLLGFMLFLNKKYTLSGISFGLFMAIKSPFLIIVVFLSIATWLFFCKQFGIKKMALLVMATILTYVLTYSVSFAHGHGLIYFLKVQKYIIHFYSIGAKAVVGAVFPMIISGRWYTWFSPVQIVSEWNILWAVGLLGSAASIFIWLKQRKDAVLLVFLWLGYYLLFLTFTPVFPRYLLLVIPFMYNLSIWGLSSLIGSKLRFLR